jgi:hypothetical protein
MERLGLLMAGGLPELEHLLPNSPNHGVAGGNTHSDFVMGYFDMFGTTGPAE